MAGPRVIKFTRDVPLEVTVRQVGAPVDVAITVTDENGIISTHRMTEDRGIHLLLSPFSQSITIQVAILSPVHSGARGGVSVQFRQAGNLSAAFELYGGDRELELVRHTIVAVAGREVVPLAAEREQAVFRKRRPTATPKTELDRAEYVVWYATTRQPKDPHDNTRGYSARRDSVVHYGSCRVFIPRSHKIGSTGSPWWKRLLTGSDDRLKLLDIRETSADSHWEQIRLRVDSVSAGEGDALIFVHGYNVTFRDAAVRTAQIGFDLSIKGPTAFFSWPSQGTLDGYLADAATVEASEDSIATYLSDFARHSGAPKVHVIVHSMGNRAVLRAVNRIAEAAQTRSGVEFGQFMLAAADVDADTFRRLASAYTNVARRTTLYVSERDRAVESSRWIHRFARAGLIPPVMIVPGVDTINVTNADLTLLGHGYVASARDVLQDMHELIRHDSAPDRRFGLKAANTVDGERYWLIGA